MNILFTICGRAGSKGFKNKNLKSLNGVPLIYYTLAVIAEYTRNHPDQDIDVIVNTDSKELISQVEKQHVVKAGYVDRREELAGDTVPKIDVIKDTYLQSGSRSYDLVIDLDITSPLRTVSDIENIIQVMAEGKYDLVFSVVEARRNPYFNMVEKKSDGFYRKICNSGFTARQQAPKAYELNASIYAYDPAFLGGEINKTILDYNCGVSIMEDSLVLDIDSENDFQMMQYLHRYYCETNQGLNKIFTVANELLESSMNG